MKKEKRGHWIYKAIKIEKNFMKQKIITIKAKGKSGFTRTLGEIEFSQMIDKDDFDIITSQKMMVMEYQMLIGLMLKLKNG